MQLFLFKKSFKKYFFIKIRVDFNYKTTNHCTSGEIILLLIYFCCCLLPRSYTTFFVLLLLLLLLAVAAHLLLFRFYFHSIHKNTQNFFFVSAHCNFHGSFSRLLLVGLVCFKIKLWKSQRVVHEQSNKLCYGYYFFSERDEVVAQTCSESWNFHSLLWNALKSVYVLTF